VYLDGLTIQNNNTGVISYYTNDTHDTNSISKGGVVYSLDNGTAIYGCAFGIAENGGLDLFNIATKKFKHYLHGLIVWRIFKSTKGKCGHVQARGFFIGMIHWILLYKLEIKTLNLPKQRLNQ
jgi:hypothetical protein